MARVCAALRAWSPRKAHVLARVKLCSEVNGNCGSRGSRFRSVARAKRHRHKDGVNATAVSQRPSVRRPVNDDVPLEIARLIHARHPYFFSTAPTRIDIVDRLIGCLECARQLGGEFEVHFEALDEGVSATLTWTGDPELVFIASGHDGAESLFRATLLAIEHPYFAACFAETRRAGE